MTYDLRERSIQDGEPVELYQFARGTRIERYTSAKTEVMYLGELWQPAFIQRSAIDFSIEKSRNDLKINTVRDFSIADLFRTMPPSDVILVTVHRLHFLQNAGQNDGAVIWAGRVLNCEFNGSTAQLSCEPISSSLQRVGLRRMYQRQCPHVLYGAQCGLYKDDYAFIAVVQQVDGLSVFASTVTQQPDGYFSGGYIDVVLGGQVERRFITEHVGSLFSINLVLPLLQVGDFITVYAGCDHNLNTCDSKFHNAENYGGMPFIPTKNPFGSAVF